LATQCAGFVVKNHDAAGSEPFGCGLTSLEALSG
jgi:hypothetical protein